MQSGRFKMQWIDKKRKRPVLPRQANVPWRIKAVLPFIRQGLFDPEGQVAAAGLNKERKRPVMPRQANVRMRKKGGLPFILRGVN